jgi:hypothetical protein
LYPQAEDSPPEVYDKFVFVSPMSALPVAFMKASSKIKR